MANLTHPEPVEETAVEEAGHIVKARYTPVQHTVLSVEEEDSPHRTAIDSFESLAGMPVVIGQLHSQLAPAAAAIKRSSAHRARVAYIMTDTAALPLAFSRLAAELREKGLIDCTITAGQAFGGEMEAVNVYTALIAARQAAAADAVVICPGPGHVGTGTRFGFSAIEQGEIVNAVNLLGGSAIAIARISYADPRPRHQGLSHHTLTALGLVAMTKCTLALPMIDQMKLQHHPGADRPQRDLLPAQGARARRQAGDHRAAGEGRSNVEHGPVLRAGPRVLPRRLRCWRPGCPNVEMLNVECSIGSRYSTFNTNH